MPSNTRSTGEKIADWLIYKHDTKGYFYAVKKIAGKMKWLSLGRATDKAEQKIKDYEQRLEQDRIKIEQTIKPEIEDRLEQDRIVELEQKIEQLEDSHREQIKFLENRLESLQNRVDAQDQTIVQLQATVERLTSGKIPSSQVLDGTYKTTDTASVQTSGDLPATIASRTAPAQTSDKIDKKKQAGELRREGWSYRGIGERLDTPKSTVMEWCKGITPAKVRGKDGKFYPPRQKKRVN